ncbi:hypothetical protein BRADI_3g28991v3 [Brachypodium distachyon]|uniref:Uncharacterized protein n=1 Tax=Brachypodium distachyon TaxID=15368 RepID=A0A2K2CZW6_BRADI|nr:hypothetical protein BRADI_3g28991v3 [Brachypodium distachyon]PNT67565.1 hypothetical protein BRADI_3g28991v3 [Brachypodium distachyon]
MATRRSPSSAASFHSSPEKLLAAKPQLRQTQRAPVRPRARCAPPRSPACRCSGRRTRRAAAPGRPPRRAARRCSGRRSKPPHAHRRSPCSPLRALRAATRPRAPPHAAALSREADGGAPGHGLTGGDAPRVHAGTTRPMEVNVGKGGRRRPTTRR